MKLPISSSSTFPLSLLLASSITSVLAAPTTTTTSNTTSSNNNTTTIQITDFRSRAAACFSASMHFVVTDKNYPDDTPTDCNLLWTYGQTPPHSTRCNNSAYFIKFPMGAINFHKFVLELERVPGTGPLEEIGRVELDSNAEGTKWVCVEDPEEEGEGVRIDCGYRGGFGDGDGG